MVGALPSKRKAAPIARAVCADALPCIGRKYALHCNVNLGNEILLHTGTRHMHASAILRGMQYHERCVPLQSFEGASEWQLEQERKTTCSLGGKRSRWEKRCQRQGRGYPHDSGCLDQGTPTPTSLRTARWARGRERGREREREGKRGRERERERDVHEGHWALFAD